MVKVLILDADCPAGIEATQSLGRSGAQVHVASPSPDALVFRSRYCAARLQQPLLPEETIRWIINLDNEYAFDLIIPATEHALMAFLEPACTPELYRKAVLPSRDALLLAMNKERVLQLAHSLDIPSPPSCLVSAGENVDLPFGFPVAVKPIHSKKMQGDELLDLRVAYAHSTGELQQILAAMPDISFQVQKLVYGHGVGVNLLFAHGEPVWHFAHERLHELPLTGGGSSYRRSVDVPADLLAHSIKLLKALHWHGVAMVEWKIDPQHGAYLMEINPRLWGSLALPIDAGVNFPLGMLALAQGRDPGPQPAYKVPYYTRDLTRDFDWQTANLTADHGNRQLLVRPRLRAVLELMRPLLLRESWDYFDFADLGLTFHRAARYVTERCSRTARRLKKKQPKAQSRTNQIASEMTEPSADTI